MPMIYIGGYDSDGLIQMVCHAPDLCDAQRSLVDAGYPTNRQIALDQAETARTHQVDVATGALIPKPVAAAVPKSITRSQLLMGLKNARFITASEAIEAATIGAVPSEIEAVFSSLPPDQEVDARIIWGSMQSLRRDQYLVPILAAGRGMTEADIDAFFIECSKL